MYIIRLPGTSFWECLKEVLPQDTFKAFLRGILFNKTSFLGEKQGTWSLVDDEYTSWYNRVGDILVSIHINPYLLSLSIKIVNFLWPVIVGHWYMYIHWIHLSTWFTHMYTCILTWIMENVYGKKYSVVCIQNTWLLVLFYCSVLNEF